MLYFKSLKDYARKNDIDWRTAKVKLSSWYLVELEFKKKKVIIEMNEIIKFLLIKLTNDNKEGIHDWPSA